MKSALGQNGISFISAKANDGKSPHFMTKKTLGMRQADNVIIQHVPCTKGFATGLQMNAIYKTPLPIEKDMPYFTAYGIYGIRN